jgi:hypothetical protein
MFNVKRIEEYDPNLRARMTRPSVPRINWFKENSRHTSLPKEKQLLTGPAWSEARVGKALDSDGARSGSERVVVVERRIESRRTRLSCVERFENKLKP